MAHTQDYITARDAEFDGWLANLTGYVAAKTSSTAWTHIPPEKVTALNTHTAEWHAAYAKTLGPHTSVDTEEKNDQRKAAEGFVRPFIQQYLKFDPVSNEDRTAMNLHNRDATHTSIGKPVSRALITDLKALGGFRVEIRFQDETTPDSHAIPYGCLLNYTVAPEKAAGYAALTQTKLMTRSPFVLDLPPEAEGQFISCAARWQNERGELGPWGEMQESAIA